MKTVIDENGAAPNQMGDPPALPGWQYFENFGNISPAVALVLLKLIVESLPGLIPRRLRRNVNSGF